MVDVGSVIMLVMGLGAAYLFYDTCMVKKACGFGLPPEVPGYVGPPVINEKCTGGYVPRNGKCVCNTIVKPCPPGQSLIINSNTCACNDCAALGRFSCPSGTKGAPHPSGAGCNCVPVSGGTPKPMPKPAPTPTPKPTGCSGLGKSGNCTWDCKNAYCWTGTNCKGTSKSCTSPGQSSNRNTGCTVAKNRFLANAAQICSPCNTCRGGACKGLTGASCTACCGASGYTSTSFRARAQFRPRRPQRPQNPYQTPTIRGRSMMAQTVMFG